MKKRVLILCAGNSARSQVAEGVLRHDGGDAFEVESAGRRLSLGLDHYLTRDHQLAVHQAVVFQEPSAPLESRVFPWKVAQTVFYDFLLPSRLPRGVCLASPAPLSIVLLAM